MTDSKEKDYHIQCECGKFVSVFDVCKDEREKFAVTIHKLKRTIIEKDARIKKLHKQLCGFVKLRDKKDAEIQLLKIHGINLKEEAEK